MFTGIIESSQHVVSTTNNALIISRPKKFTELFIGQSIAINGACLSVTKYTQETICFDVLTQTFRVTNLETSKMVNLERAMLANARFEGHVVLGHVDGTIPLLEKKQEESGIEYVFEIPNQKKLLVEKGSITLNGVSLTIGNITKSTFSVFLIPLTLEHTNLGVLEVGSIVNFEYDYLAKIIANT